MAARVPQMRKDEKLGWLVTPDCEGGTLTEAHRLLAEVYQLLNEYSPLWYPEDLHYRLQAALRSPKRNTRPRVVGKYPRPAH